MTTEIINLAPVTIDSKSFKDERLSQATERIARIYQNAAKYADEKNREIARVLAEVADQKSYVTDGFKSVAEYANKTFGIARQNAYALATAGKVYNDEAASDALKAFSPSKLAEIASLDSEKVNQDIESGEISANSTQKSLREYASKVKSESGDKSTKTEVVDMYTARPCLSIVPEVISADMSTSRTIEEWDSYFLDAVALLTGDSSDNVEMSKLSKGYVSLDAKKATLNRRLYFNKYMSIVVEYYRYVPSVSKEEITSHEFTVEQLQAMLAKAMEEQSNN